MLKPHEKIVFEETFKSPNLNRDVWNIEVGEKWFNAERQCYVDQRKNLVFHENGMRLIADLNPDSDRCRYQSTRMNTRGKKEWQYGTFIVRAKVPKGVGSWPAIWFLPTDIGKVKWPLCGEIDLMEHVGYNPEVIHFSLHSQKQNHIIHTQRTKFETIPGVLDDFHDYKMIWRPEGISFFVDEKHYVTFEKKPDDLEDSWPFDKPYYLILNIAVGGTWGGQVNEQDLPYVMDIASIKVYQ
jgi:beta-glucanase (GH16 family)